jgi:hypothetical protein
MLETPSIRRYSPDMGSDNATGADNQQERLRDDAATEPRYKVVTKNPQRLYAELPFFRWEMR